MLRQEDAPTLTQVIALGCTFGTWMWTQAFHHPTLRDHSQNQMDINSALMPGAQAAGNRVLGQSPQSPVEEKWQIHPRPNAITSWEDFRVQSSGWKECEEGQWFGSGFAYQNVLQQLCFCCLVLRYLFWNWPMVNLWARFLPRCLGLKRATKRNKVWKSPSSIHSLLAPAFISGKSFRFEAKSLVGEDRSRQKARGTTSNLQVGYVTRTIWKYWKEQTDPGGSVNSLPCEH